MPSLVPLPQARNAPSWDKPNDTVLFPFVFDVGAGALDFASSTRNVVSIFAWSNPLEKSTTETSEEALFATRICLLFGALMMMLSSFFFFVLLLLLLSVVVVVFFCFFFLLSSPSSISSSKLWMQSMPMDLSPPLAFADAWPNPKFTVA